MTIYVIFCLNLLLAFLKTTLILLSIVVFVNAPTLLAISSLVIGYVVQL